MRIPSLLEPVSDNAPSGPDLEATGDWQYGEYISLASAQLPSRFFSKDESGSDRDIPFDSSRIDIDAEQKAIDGFLTRSRDVRLLTLEAQFQALSGSIVGFGQSLADLAEMITVFWDSAHPNGVDGDFQGRVNAVENLENQVHVILPLTYASIVGSGAQTVTYRAYAVAAGKARARTGEDVLGLDVIFSQLADRRNTETVQAINEAVVLAQTALKDIRTVFGERAGENYVPNFERLQRALSDIAELLVAGQPDLAPKATGVALSSDGTAAPGTPSAAPSVGAVRISTRSEASAALEAVEHYFQTQEPSAPALILVHQARMLLGKPLVVALEALFPFSAASAVLRFDSGLRFDIGLSQMKLVTDDVSLNDDTDNTEEGEPDPGAEFTAPTRNDAAALMIGIEAYYRSAEPSSPVPLLLAKARSYLNKDFSAILNEILPKEPT